MFEETRKALADFMEQSKKSQRKISKETDLSTSVISQFLDGTYTGDNAKVAQAIERYLSVGRERMNAAREVPLFLGLRNTQEVLFACNYAHRHNDITLVSGDAGAGKTTALHYYDDNGTGIIFVTANACTTTATAVLGLICEKLSMQIPGRRAALMSTLVAALKDTNRLIIIDEADHLSLEALQAVRNLNDEAHVGIVLSGNDKIYTQMNSPRRSSDFGQIRTRIVVRRKVYNTYTVEEMEAMFPDTSRDCLGYLLLIAESESLRTARKIFVLAQELAQAKGRTVTAKDLKAIQGQLMGTVIAS